MNSTSETPGLPFTPMLEAAACSRTPRKQERLLLGAAAVLPPRQAAELLPWSDQEARAWLRQKGLVLTVDGHEIVIWGDVLDALRARPEPLPEAPKKNQRKGTKHEVLKRFSLDVQ